MSTKKPSVLFLTSWYPNKKDPQLGIFVKKQALAVSQYVNVEVIYVTSGSDSSEETTVINEHFVERILYFKKTEGILGKYSALKSWKKTYKKAFLEANTKPDLVHVHNAFPIGWLIKTIKKRFNTPVIYSESWSGFVNKKSIPFYKMKIIQRLSKKADLILTVSKFLQLEMQNAGVSGHFEVVGNVIDNIDSNTEKHNNGTTRMLNVSDLNDEIKNISGLISAFYKANIGNAELHIIGDGPDFDSLLSLANQLEAMDRKVVFHGRLANSEVLQLMSRFDFGIINSQYETFSMVGAEFVLSGLPIITTDCGGPKEFFREGMGLMIRPNKEGELIAAMENMTANFSKYRLKEEQEYIRENFSSESIGRLLFEHYSSLLKN